MSAVESKCQHLASIEGNRDSTSHWFDPKVGIAQQSKSLLTLWSYFETMTKCHAYRLVVYLTWLTLLPISLCDALTLTHLNIIERAFLTSRLMSIKSAVERKYQHLANTEKDRYTTFIFPGAGGVDALVEELCFKMKDSTIIIDWSEHRGSILTAAYDGEAVGEAIANLLLRRNPHETEIHFIGISVGAFCANAAATVAYRTLSGSTSVRLTLLDPFCGRGVFGPSYGKDNFGKYATTAIQILNTDDPVPTTNDPLPNCYCLDVTAAPERNTFVSLPGDSMHSWPVAYMARHFQDPSGTLQKGAVVKVGK